MEPAKVYYTDFRVSVGTSLLTKLKRLCVRAGFQDMELDGRFVAIKMHFGELGNMAFIRPQYVRVLADLVKEKGGIPFLTDCNTLYPGSRRHAPEHLDCANLNGFNPTTTGCQIIIGDGLKGTDEVEVPIKNAQVLETAKIGRAVMDADVFVSFAHFKGHESTGFGGAVKNIGMGCGSRAGKMEQHSSGKVAVHEELCKACHRCAKECGSNAISYGEDRKARIDEALCKGCGRCIGSCSFDALYNEQWDANDILDRKMAEYAQAVVQDRPCFHINMVMDISPWCDCHGENDAPILPNIGMFASLDPIALDQACVDACMQATPLPDSQLADHRAKAEVHGHVFDDLNPDSMWEETLIHAEKIGMGTRQYELIKVK